MAGIVNLRRSRKRRARDEARTDANAARHGEPKPARRLREAKADLEARRLEAHRRNKTDGEA